MSDRRSARPLNRTGWAGQKRLLALIGSGSAAVAFLASAGAVRAAPAATPSTARPGPSVALAGATATVPPGATRLGPERSASVVHLDVVLSPRDPAALTRYATQVATPGSPLYHDYLPKGAFASVFGPTRAAIATVRTALTSVGLHPGKISANHLAIPVTATASQVESALGIKLDRYRLAGGHVGYLNRTAPRLPASAAPYVESIIGLDTLIRMRPLLTKPSKATGGRAWARGTVQPQDATGGPQPCTAAVNVQNGIITASGGASWVLTADQLAFDYEFGGQVANLPYQKGDFGKGQTIGIIELGESNLTSDISNFQNCYGTNAPVSYLNIDGFKPKGAGEGEAALDIETVASLAPEANIVVYRGPSNGTGWYDTFGTAAAADVAQVESVSYGLCEAAFGQLLGKNLAGALNVIFEQQAVQGQTVLVSSGDTGSEGCLRVAPKQPGLLSTEFPGSDPFVLSVGGTSILSSDPVARNAEVVWNDSPTQDGAGGGGESAFFTEPSYQKSFGISDGNTRGVPDVSADADPESGYLVFWNGGWIQIGGTSAAAPLWAALMALTNAECPSSPVGFVNPAIYFAASPKVKAIVANDIIKQQGFDFNDTNDYTGKSGQYPVLTGYDLATGVGSPVGGPLATQLCKTSTQAGGYRLAAADGHVYSFHTAGYGSVKNPKSKVVGIADDPKTNGYWVVTAKGAVSAFHAPFHGSAKNPSSPIVGIAADNNGTGYWLVTAKGHVYALGAPSHGSVTGTLASPVVGIAADPFTSGYWVVTAKGKVYAFAAGNYKGKSLSKVTAIAADPAKQAYWLVTSNGHVYGFNVNSQGSMPAGNLFGNITAIAGDPASGGAGGYWLTTTFGLVAAFNAEIHGAHPFQTTKNPIVGIASTH
ncbi:MAG TPA: S53 family peptidase [Streptosporangiaceae bacterium]|nr:S53 family peptidase [Streptosporangiaceae bacterium]